MLKSLFRSTLIVGILAGIAGVGAYWAISYLIRHEDPIIVPDLTGKEIVSVLEMLSQLGLHPKLEKREYSRTLGKNRVITQDPPPGAQIKKGRDLRLTLSKGSRTLSMPDLMGLSYEEARTFLIAQDLCQGVVSHTRNPNRGRNEVLAQTPLPGIPTSREDCVDLLINRGKEGDLYMMPDLTGEILAKGLARITESGVMMQCHQAHSCVFVLWPDVRFSFAAPRHDVILHDFQPPRRRIHGDGGGPAFH